MTRLSAIAADARPHVVVTTRDKLATRDAVPELASATWLAVDALPAPSTSALRPRARPEDLAILPVLVGLDRRSRGVMLTHANLLHNAGLIRRGVRATHQSSIVLSWLPFQHDMGLIGRMLQPVYVGFPVPPDVARSRASAPGQVAAGDFASTRGTVERRAELRVRACVRHVERNRPRQSSICRAGRSRSSAPSRCRLETIERFVRDVRALRVPSRSVLSVLRPGRGNAHGHRRATCRTVPHARGRTPRGRAGRCV